MGELGVIFNAMSSGLAHVFSLSVFPIMLLGIIIGMILGLIPGLGGLIGFALLIPFAITMEPVTGLAFLLGMSAVTTQTDTIPAVILGVPGTSAAMATSLDGYPMAKRGEAGRALCASYYASIFGTIVTAGLFILLLPVLRSIIFSIGQPEFFMLIMMGLMLAGALAGNSLVRGLTMAAAGLLLSMITDETSIGEARFAFGFVYLWGGLPLIPVVLGLFAIPEVIDLARTNRTISATSVDTRVSGLKQGLVDVVGNWWLVIKASTLGSIAGFIPGLGGQVAEWMAYGAAVSSDEDPKSFGKGNVRGVVAAEAGTAAQKPGALIPTLVFGIPGNGGMALMLAVLMMLEVTPGPEMVTGKLDITFGMIWIIIIANIIAAVIALGLQRWLILLCYLRPAILVPMVLGTMLVGATMANQAYGDVVVFVIFGLLGYLFKHTDWPRVPLIMGLIMGGLAERYLFLSIDLHGFNWLTDRPIVWVIALVTFVIVFLPPILRNYRSKKMQKSNDLGVIKK